MLLAASLHVHSELRHVITMPIGFANASRCVVSGVLAFCMVRGAVFQFCVDNVECDRLVVSNRDQLLVLRPAVLVGLCHR
jgi:hypothetical protein